MLWGLWGMEKQKVRMIPSLRVEASEKLACGSAERVQGTASLWVREARWVRGEGDWQEGMGVGGSCRWHLL